MAQLLDEPHYRQIKPELRGQACALFAGPMQRIAASRCNPDYGMGVNILEEVELCLIR